MRVGENFAILETRDGNRVRVAGSESNKSAGFSMDAVTVGAGLGAATAATLTVLKLTRTVAPIAVIPIVVAGGAGALAGKIASHSEAGKCTAFAGAVTGATGLAAYMLSRGWKGNGVAFGLTVGALAGGLLGAGLGRGIDAGHSWFSQATSGIVGR